MPMKKGTSKPRKNMNYPKERKRKATTELSGMRFGRLVVKSHEGFNKHNCKTWLCICDCGKETVVPTGNLRKGNTQSCGCLMRELSVQSAKRLPHLVLPYGVSQKNYVLTRYRGQSRASGRVWNLSTAEAQALLVGNCHYCGNPPSNIATNKRCNGEFVYNGIDRIDSARGYEVGNVVSCCKRCNVAKNDMTYEEFVSWISRVYRNFVVEGGRLHAAS